jgi:hypothetical protein
MKYRCAMQGWCGQSSVHSFFKWFFSLGFHSWSSVYNFSFGGMSYLECSGFQCFGNTAVVVLRVNADWEFYESYVEQQLVVRGMWSIWLTEQRSRLLSNEEQACGWGKEVKNVFKGHMMRWWCERSLVTVWIGKGVVRKFSWPHG